MTKTSRLIQDSPAGMGWWNFVSELPQRRGEGQARKNVTCLNRSSPRARSPRFGIAAGRRVRHRRQTFETSMGLRIIRRRLVLLSGTTRKNHRGLLWKEWMWVVVLWLTCEDSVEILPFVDNKWDLHLSHCEATCQYRLLYVAPVLFVCFWRWTWNVERGRKFNLTQAFKG